LEHGGSLMDFFNTLENSRSYSKISCLFRGLFYI
jgi:hypothetical protein